METELERKPKITRGRNFTVEQNVDAIQWPHDCAVCGNPPQTYDNVHLSKNFKNLGRVSTTVANIPYCSTCYPKIKATKRLDKSVGILAMVFGIPLGIFLAALMAKQPGTQFICIGLLVVVGIGIAYGIFWLLIRFPIKSIFKNRYVDYVDAWYVEAQGADKQPVLNVVIEIPNRAFADKFAILNSAVQEAAK